MKLSFTVLGSPVSQGSMTALRSKSTGRAIVKAPKHLDEWRYRVAASGRVAFEEIRGEGAELLDGPLALSVRFFLPRPKSAPKKRTSPTVKPDIDKLVRAVHDALEGILYRSDSQIVALQASKVYGEPARAEVDLVAAEVEAVRAA